MRNLVTAIRATSVIPAIAVIAVIALAAPALAADRVVGPGREFSTVQAAVDAAITGDRVVVQRGVYRENVTVGVSGISIVGRPGAVLDGTLGPGSSGVCLTVNGDDVTVTGIAFRAATSHVVASGARVAVRRCVLRTAGAAGIQITGPEAVVADCLIQGTRAGGIVLSGPGAVVLRNRVTGTGATAVTVAGDDAEITGNQLRGIDGGGISVTGAGAGLSRNVVAQADGLALRVVGALASVTRNRLSATSDGLLSVTGDDARVEGNRMSASGATACLVAGDRMRVTGNRVSQLANDTDACVFTSRTPTGGGTIEDNVVEDCVEYGFDIGTNNATYRRNLAVRCGSEEEYGFTIRGTGNVLEDCEARDCDSIGFQVGGSSTILRRCRAVRATFCGFEITGTGVSVSNCTAAGATVGIGNGGTGTVLSGGAFTGNRFDLCRRSAATWAEVSGPRFSTGGRDVVFGGF